MALPATLQRQILRTLNRRARSAEVQSRIQQPGQLGPSVGGYTGEGERVLGHLFDRQIALIKDESRKKAARCGRRAGKTTTAAAYLCRAALNRAGALCGYITVTRKQAKRLIWAELKRLNRHYDLGATFNETDLVVKFPNGSEIWVSGADKEDQIEKFRGVAFLLVVLDETASFKAHIEQLVEEVLEPTLEDYDGTVMMIGTPSRACTGMFHAATTEEDNGWSKHHWTVLDNPRFPRWRNKPKWREAARRWLDDLKARKKWDDDDPVFLREWLARWVRDLASLVYRWSEGRNGKTWSIALSEAYEWRFILGVDLGHDDATAFVLVAFSPDLPWCVVVHAEKSPGLDITDVAKRIKKLQEQYEPASTVVDTGGLGKMIVAEMQKRHQLPMKPAEKKDKLAFQEAINADLRKERVFVDVERCGTLVAEWELLQKDETGYEDSRFENHCADATLYAWREARHYMHEPKDPEPEVGSQAYYDKIEREMMEADEDDVVELDEVEAIWA